MYSTQGLNQKVILFAGRPTDSRKGLCLLLEAISILSELSDLPSFNLWIVGGSPRECEVMTRFISSQSNLKKLEGEGRLLLWGRVENAAMSEIYSRATVTVIPSHREEFGIVAVESMMCGCPVIAARTGGLQDIVLHNVTGTLFDADDILALAAAISSYIRNDELSRLQGINARQRAVSLFERNTIYSSLAEVYKPDSPHSGESEAAGGERLVDSRVTTGNYSRLHEVFGQELELIGTPAHGKHPVIIFDYRGQRFAAKFFHLRASLQSSVFPRFAALETKRGGLVAYSRTLANVGNPSAPEIVYSESLPAPLVITRWCAPADLQTLEDQDQFMLMATQSFGKHNRVDPEASDRLMECMENLSLREDYASIRKIDQVSAELNSALTGGAKMLCRIHPQAELWRFRLLLRSGNWSLPTDFSIRAQDVIEALIEGQGIISDYPTLAHADPKQDHMLCTAEGYPILADLEHSRYAVGPLDVATWICLSGIRTCEKPNALTVIRRIEQLYQDRASRYACMCWIVAESLFNAILGLSQGERKNLARAQCFFSELPLSLFSRDFIL